MESLSADNGCTGTASTFKTQGQRSHDSCSWTACVANAGSVGPSSPHLGNVPQQVLGAVCKAAEISHGLSLSSQKQALLPDLVSFSVSEPDGLQIDFK